MLAQSPPHPATRLLLWKSISCVSQAASCRVCYGMASAPAPAGSPDLSVILSDSVSFEPCLFGTKDPLLEMQRAGVIGQSTCTHMVPTEKKN